MNLLKKLFGRGWNRKGSSSEDSQSSSPDRTKAEVLYQQAKTEMQVGGLKEKALGYLNEAIKTDPTFADAYDARSNVYASMGRADESLADIKKCAELGGKTRNNTIGGLPEDIDNLLKRHGF